MKIATLALVGALVFGAQSAPAADTAGMMKPINGFIAASLTGKPFASFVTASPSIIDEVPPYHWSGPGAGKAWLADVGAWAKANGVTDLGVKLGAPTRVEQTASRGYVVTPAVFTYKQNGKAEREDAAMAFALDRSRSGWRIAALAWTGGAIKP
jgi:hypothetical protein